MGGECDDGDPGAYPSAEEVFLDGVDNDCDPSTLDDPGPEVVTICEDGTYPTVAAADEGATVYVCPGEGVTGDPFEGNTARYGGGAVEVSPAQPCSVLIGHLQGRRLHGQSGSARSGADGHCVLSGDRAPLRRVCAPVQRRW